MGIKRKIVHSKSTVIFSLDRRVMDLVDDLMIVNPMIESAARFAFPGILLFPGNNVHPSHPQSAAKKQNMSRSGSCRY